MGRALGMFWARLGLVVLMVVSGPQMAVAYSTGFTSPSGNMICYLQVDWEQEDPIRTAPFVCLVGSADWDPPVDYGDDDPTCGLDETRIVILPPDGPATERWVCHGDIFWPFNGAIGYGSEWWAYGYSCTMETTGVSCQNSQGNGFHVRRSERTLY